MENNCNINAVYKLCGSCTKEYKVEFGETLTDYIAVMFICPHCGVMEHILMRISKNEDETINNNG
jgi:predicted RNA-binding Zn-ribbon protein involved in translation (DUF1610 family)